MKILIFFVYWVSIFAAIGYSVYVMRDLAYEKPIVQGAFAFCVLYSYIMLFFARDLDKWTERETQ